MHLYGRRLLESFARIARGGWRYRLVIAAALFSVLLGAACDDDDDPAPAAVTVASTAVANAGSDQTAFTSKTVTLNGSASTGATTYAWTQTAGTTVTLSSTSSATPSFTSPATAENLTFSLMVSDGTTNSVPDTVVVEVVQTDDTFFSNQWHLSNTGQASGTTGETPRSNADVVMPSAAPVTSISGPPEKPGCIATSA